MPVTDRPRWMHPRHPISQATNTQLQQHHDAASGIGEDNMEIGEDCEAPSVPPRTLTPTVEIDEVDRSDRPPPLPPRCPYGWALVAEEAQRMRDSRWAFFPESYSYYRTEPIEPCTVGEDLSKDGEVEDYEPQSFGDKMRDGEGRGHCENDLPGLGRENYEDWHQRREGKNEMFDVDVQENKGGDKGHTEEAATSVETGENREEETLSGSLNKENEKRTDTEVDGSGNFGNGSDGDKVNVIQDVRHQKLTFQEPTVSMVTCAKLDALDHRLLNTEKTQKRRAPLPPLSASLPPPLSPIVLPAQFPLGSHESSAPSTHLHPHHQSLALPHCASQDTEDLDQNVNVRRGRRHSTSGRLVTASQVINPLFEDSWEHGEEVFSFCHSVAKIRELFPHSDTETNPGWSLAQARVPAGPQGLLFRVLVDYGRKEGPVIFSTDSDSPVELLLIQLLCLLSLELPSVQQLQHYFLQPHGLQQVLQRERSVVSHDCVQRSQRVGQLPHFQLLHSTDKILAFARTAKDDETPTSLDIDWTAHGCTRRKALGRQGMSMMMDMYHSEVDTLRLNQTLTPGGVDRMVQAVKAACLSMDSVETAAVTAGVRALRCLSLAGDSVNSDNFPDSFWEPVTASHQPPLEALTSALHDICDLFRRTFRTEPITSLEAPCGVQNMTVEQSLGIAGNNGDEEVRTDNECESHRHERTAGETESEEMVGTMEGDETDEVEIIFGGEIVEPTKGCDNAFSCDNSFQCIFSSSLTTDVLEITLYALHKLPSAWLSNYENYHMECRVWHSSKELGKAWKSQQVTPLHHFFQLVLWNERRTFPLSLSQLPRESRLTFDLYGLAPPPLSDTGTAPAVPHVPELIGHADLRIFDFQSVLVQGSQLLPLCLCGVEEGLERGPLFELHFPQLGCEVVFQTPSPARLAPPRPPRDLDTETRKRLITMMAGASVLFSLTKSECTWLWSRRASLKLEPGSLPWLLASAPSWDSEALPRIYSLLRDACISPEHALEILHPLFPDKEVRHAAVRSLHQLTDDELMDWLPQLVQALQSEWHIDSCLAHFLLTRATASVRVAHHLYWQLRVSLANGNRRSPVANQAVLAALLSCIGSAQHQALAAQSRLVKILHEAAGNVRHAPQGQPRRDALSASIPSLQDFFSQEGQVRLPLDPEFVARGIDKDGCSYFSSYTVPLRLSFLNAQPGAPNLEFIFKTGDDMRQDALALQLMALMDRLWLRDGLDMHCVSFRCQPTGYRQGLVELVPGAETLRQIQTRHGVTGSFRDSLLSAWLREHNPSARQLQQAEERFIASCAGSCVATYVLGVCDRHNDNVLLCPSGSLFHIDFGRWLGHAQTLGNIRRDRVPFVLTADMAYIINGADHPTSRFDDFVDICCQAYNCLRKHTRLILVHLALMMECGLPELSSSRDLRYVQEALLPGVTEQQAADMFTSLIKASLSSLSTRVNFFIHNLAQLRQPGGGSSRNTAMGSLPTLSFVPSVHSLAADGRVTTVTVVNYEKRYNPEKYYVFVVEVKREGQTGASRVFRSFLEFQELHAKLCMLPAGSFVPRFPTRLIIGRAQTREVAARRAADLHGFLQILLRCPPAISESDLLYTFLHPLPHDHPRANLDIIQTTPEGFEVVSLGNVAGELSLEICYRNGRLFVLILSCRGLVPETGLELAPFVRTLLLPDPHRSTKRKTRSLNHSLNPDFCEMLVYGGYSEEALSRRLLHLSVCSDGSVTILGTTVFPLSDMIFPGPHTFTLTLHTNPLA